MQMTRFFRSRTVLIGAGCFALYGVAFALIPAPFFGEILNAVLFSVSAGVVVTYSSFAFQAACNRSPSSQDYLLLGIWLGWLAMSVRGAVALYWRYANKPPEFTDNFLWLLVLHIAVVSATLHLTAPGAIDGRVPARNWILLGIAVAFGLALMSLAYWVVY